MSVWGDIRRRAEGRALRTEDKVKEITWPQILKEYGKTIATDIIPVQPMDPPKGIIIYCDYFDKL